MQRRRNVPGVSRRYPRAFDKFAYLHAHFRFVVSDAAPVATYLRNADLPVDWDEVAEVIENVPLGGTPRCPITLDEVQMPVITRCGHVFELHAIVQHFLHAASDSSELGPVPCPLCFDPLFSRDLRLLSIRQVRPPTTGDRVAFSLLRRPRDGSFASPVDPSDTEAARACARLLLTPDATPLFVAKSLELRELARAAAGGKEGAPPLAAIEVTQEILALQAQRWSEVRQRAVNERAGSSADAVAAGRQAWEAVHRVELLPKPPPPSTKEDFPALSVMPKPTVPATGFKQSSAPKFRTWPIAAPEGKDDIRFYQSRDGQALFLRGVCLRMLLRASGSYDQLPARIEGTLIELETVTASPEARRRLPALSHVPLLTHMALCELNLSHEIPPDVSAEFAQELDARRRRREREERRVANRDRRDNAARERAENPSFPEGLRPPPPAPEEFEALPGLRAGAAWPDSLGGPAVPPAALPIPLPDGVSYATLTRLGIAARGPALSAAVPPSAPSVTAVPWGLPTSAGSRDVGGWPPGGERPALSSPQTDDRAPNARGKRRPKVTLLFGSGAQRAP